MKKWMVVLGLTLVLLVAAVGAVTAKDNKLLVKFLFYDEADTEYYCEGIFMKTGSGIVHEWRDNPECISWGMPISNFHLVFKPTDKFDNEGWEEEGLLGCFPGEWVLDNTYIDLGEDEADLTDFFTADSYWSCVYLWE